MSGFTVVYYFCPEDGDDVATPNAFGLPKPLGDIEFRDILQNFPLEGEYIFRAKFKQGKEVLWLDIDKTSGKLPHDDGSIFLKVKRVTWGEVSASSNSPTKPKTPAQSAATPKTPNTFDIELTDELLLNPHASTNTAKSTPHVKSEPAHKDLLGGDFNLSGSNISPSHKGPSKKETQDLMNDLLL